MAAADPPARPHLLLVAVAALIVALGLALRLAVPVLPVDAAFRDVLRAYGASNTRETSPP